MSRTSTFVLVTLFASVSALHVPTMENPIAQLDPEENEVLKPIPPVLRQKDDSEAWYEATVIRIYYDCRGRLVRQEVSKLRTRNDDGVQAGEVQGDLSGKSTSSPGATEAPVFFKSIPGRFAKPKVTSSPDERPVTFGPDMIIGSPIRSCPPGENDDHTGNCRKVFPEQPVGQ